MPNIEPPPPRYSINDVESCIEPPDDRIITLELQRISEKDQSQVESNTFSAGLTGCNSSIQPLVSVPEAIATMMYLATYF